MGAVCCCQMAQRAELSCLCLMAARDGPAREQRNAGETELGSIMKTMQLTPLAGDTAKVSLLVLKVIGLCPLPSALFPLTRFDTRCWTFHRMQKLWCCQISRNQTALGHGDMMIHKHSAKPFLPEQVPMGCTSYGSGSQQAAEQVPSQTAERGWAQPQQGPAEPLGLYL